LEFVDVRKQMMRLYSRRYTFEFHGIQSGLDLISAFLALEISSCASR